MLLHAVFSSMYCVVSVHAHFTLQYLTARKFYVHVLCCSVFIKPDVQQ